MYWEEEECKKEESLHPFFFLSQKKEEKVKYIQHRSCARAKQKNSKELLYNIITSWRTGYNRENRTEEEEEI